MLQKRQYLSNIYISAARKSNHRPSPATHNSDLLAYVHLQVTPGQLASTETKVPREFLV
jgi:hypothetical protein